MLLWFSSCDEFCYAVFLIEYTYSKSKPTTTDKFKIDETKVCLSVCVSLASDSLETVEVIIIKLGAVTTSDMLMHHVLIILTLTFIQSHTYLNPKKNHPTIISETIQVFPHQVCCEDSPAKGLCDHY